MERTEATQETEPINDKLRELQKCLAEIAMGNRTTAKDITPHDVGVEGMYAINRALKAAQDQSKGGTNLKI